MYGVMSDERWRTLGPGPGVYAFMHYAYDHGTQRQRTADPLFHLTARQLSAKLFLFSSRSPVTGSFALALSVRHCVNAPLR